MCDGIVVSADLARHADALHDVLECGVDGVFLHHVGQEQQRFIEAFSEKVLPELIR